MSAVRPPRRVLMAGGLAAFTASVAGPSALAAAAAPAAGPVVRLAGPTGPAPVGAVELHLVDPTRTEPAAGPGRPRELMVTVTYPAGDTQGRPVLPWLPPGAERALKAKFGGALDAVVLPATHSADGAPARCGRHPVVLYSPGYAADRGFNTLVVEDLASHGYVVVTVDHPYDSGEVEFPDGRVVLSRPGDPAEAVAVRAADLRFVLDRLAELARGGNPDAGRRPLPRGLSRALDLSRTGVFGHSRGGAAAAALLGGDARVRAGINLDGSVHGPVVERGLDRPFLLVDTAVHDGLRRDATWSALWPNLRGWRRCLRLGAGADHNAFTDLVSVGPQLGVPLPLQLGTVPADRAVAAVRATVRAFFDAQLRGRPDTGRLLMGASTRHPEIEFVAGR
ncbi:lipase [Streptomyces bambusae]|uniref:alpha/beta hydrolase family protein n=1 Tax=Streptomyces bambusae TaxID=1550616 RepID=UPI001CFFDCCF|nr:lipase [Streptomyces bambusae]MCB5169081.1 lipase [Streptomyces bambusae]